MAEQTPLRLIAEDSDDLTVISAAVQDAVIKAENFRYESRQRRFSLEINRFRWEEALGEPKRAPKTRIRSLLAFDGVLAVKTRGVSRADPDLVYSILNIEFEPNPEPPGGIVRLHFAGDGELALEVEVLDATLLDSDYEWTTRRMPEHERRRR
ncbi:MAG: hypothetical protein CME84_02855 [Henriciella sp.]|jgi:hypothetical protein|uniref:DUF2948 family protein n=1 Tax=Henriciella sp. TaxID=1968823 RepID=UPI000C0EC4C2|nr:DUF2948 family protein [Henriciella sp.]MAN73014.1 hypothetical protein [Henriciella sp.]MBF34342.1 hypothetical protein [Hyphomonadaceae bacterium]PHR75247.1 MAG: hypothetical protein COA64_12405 [Henriciella sp.]|tara:strand:+ start:2744 stop:3202 length:459 start_codon:yes stop_codon:yes gene_type:complete